MHNRSVFIGFDPRQPVAYQTAAYSVAKNASEPVSITPLILKQLPIERRGLTQFTYTRFLVPWLCDFQGSALFMDPDMIVTGDICELLDMADPISGAVQVMKEQPEFEWPSVMLFNNTRCKKLTPEYVDNPDNVMFDFAWTDGQIRPEIGEIPPEWNYCIGYSERPESVKLWHYTQGLPVWPETDGVESHAFWNHFHDSISTVTWKELMGNSVHAEPVMRRLNGTDN